jgi:hypothetical protein
MSMAKGLPAFVMMYAAIAVAQDNPSPRPLASLKRVCVERFAGDAEIGAQAREIAIASLFTAKAFAITEKCEKSDASLKGAVTRARAYRSRSEGDSTRFGENASVSNSLGRAAASATGMADERLSNSESFETASVALRLVDDDGEVVWAYTADSSGGKTKAAVADAVEQIVKQLLRDIERSKKPDSSAKK